MRRWALSACTVCICHPVNQGPGYDLCLISKLSRIADITSDRGALASEITTPLDGAKFHNQPLREDQTEHLIRRARELIDQVEDLTEHQRRQRSKPSEAIPKPADAAGGFFWHEFISYVFPSRPRPERRSTHKLSCKTQLVHTLVTSAARGSGSPKEKQGAGEPRARLGLRLLCLHLQPSNNFPLGGCE